MEFKSDVSFLMGFDGDADGCRANGWPKAWSQRLRSPVLIYRRANGSSTTRKPERKSASRISNGRSDAADGSVAD